MRPAIIPARGGSKGIPGKNLQQVRGMTLLARAIQCCQESEFIDEICVSTDSAEIAKEASAHGAKILARPEHLARDGTLSSDVLLFHLEQSLLILDCTEFAFIQCTAPLMTAEEIDETYRELVSSGADLAVAVASTDAIQVRMNDSDGALPRLETRRQHRAQMYEIAGSVWWIKTKEFMERRTLYSDCVATCACVEYRLEIDTTCDLKRAWLLTRPESAAYPN